MVGDIFHKIKGTVGKSLVENRNQEGFSNECEDSDDAAPVTHVDGQPCQRYILY